MDEILVRTRALQREYHVGNQRVMALNGVDLEVGRGEFVALAGPSGSGKSSLLNVCGGLDHPTGGQIWVGDWELSSAREAELVRYRREQVGFIFQSFHLLPTHSAVENVETPLMLAGLSRKERRTRAMELLTSVGLAARANHRPNELSGGEMQRVAIARALSNRPSLLLADEPTGNLDTRTGESILNLLRETVRERNVTLMLVTHDPRVAAVADRVIYLRDGQIERIENHATEVAAQ